MNDERRETYKRLVGKLLALPRIKVPEGPMVLTVDVVMLLADELLTERRGQGSQTESKDGIRNEEA